MDEAKALVAIGSSRARGAGGDGPGASLRIVEERVEGRCRGSKPCAVRPMENTGTSSTGRVSARGGVSIDRIIPPAYLWNCRKLRCSSQKNQASLRPRAERIGRGEYRLNEGLVDWLLSCPEKGFFVPMDRELRVLLATTSRRLSARGESEDFLRISPAVSANPIDRALVRPGQRPG